MCRRLSCEMLRQVINAMVTDLIGRAASGWRSSIRAVRMRFTGASSP
jgi:hypothetical protein